MDVHGIQKFSCYRKLDDQFVGTGRTLGFVVFKLLLSESRFIGVESDKEMIPFVCHCFQLLH